MSVADDPLRGKNYCPMEPRELAPRFLRRHDFFSCGFLSQRIGCSVPLNHGRWSWFNERPDPGVRSSPQQFQVVAGEYERVATSFNLLFRMFMD